jgi:hypothetical protein
VKFRNTIILLVVFGALLAYFLLLEKDRNPSESTGTPTPTPTNLFTFASSDVVELDLTDGTTKTTVLKRDNDAAPWKIVAPIADNGDSVTINGVVQPMSSLSASRSFTDSASTGDLATFGLAQPKLTITAKLKDGKNYSLRIGDKTPDSSNAYVQKPDDKTIYLINATLVDGASGMLDKPPVAPPTPTPTATATLTTTVGVSTTVPVTSSAPATGAATIMTGSTTIVTGSTTIIVASPTPVVTASTVVTPTTASATSAAPIATEMPTVAAIATVAPTIESTATAAFTPTAAASIPAITATAAITP